jgi:hypothetical protein
LQVRRWMSKWHGVGRVDEVVPRARRAGCRLGRRRASGMVWVGSLRMFSGLEEQVAVEEVDEIVG